MIIGASESVTAIRNLIRTAAGRGLHLDEGPTAGQPAFYARVSAAHAQRLWEHAVHELGPMLPLQVAFAADHHVNPLYFAATSCRTLGEAMQLIVDRWRYLTDAFPARMVRRGGQVHVRIEPRGPMPLGARLGIEYLQAISVRASRTLSGDEWRPRELVLGHLPPGGLAPWETACGVPVRVDPDAPGLVLDEAALGLPVRAGLSRVAGQFFLELLERYTPRTRAVGSLAERVAEALGRDLGTAAPTVEQIASELGLSARSLHRQLAAEGTSYQRVLDGLRCDEAIRQTLARRPFKAIAAAVGFADPRGFRRAFKRWTGSTPQEFRVRSAASAPGDARWVEPMTEAMLRAR